MTPPGPSDNQRLSRGIESLRANRVRKDRDVSLTGELAKLATTYSRQSTGLGAIAELWQELAPEDVRESSALKSYSRGVLTVSVEHAAQRFLLDRALRGGLRRELIRRSSSPLRTIRIITEPLDPKRRTRS